jgi:hypothetical protein
MAIAATERTADGQFTNHANHTVDTTVSNTPKTIPARTETSPVTIGRFSVRCMRASMSRS